MACCSKDAISESAADIFAVRFAAMVSILVCVLEIVSFCRSIAFCVVQYPTEG